MHHVAAFAAARFRVFVPKSCELKYALKNQCASTRNFSSISAERQNMRNILPAKPTAASAKKPAVKAETVTLRHLAVTLADSHAVPKKQTLAMLEGMVEVMTKHLKKGARIRIG